MAERLSLIPPEHPLLIIRVLSKELRFSLFSMGHTIDVGRGTGYIILFRVLFFSCRGSYLDQ
jgi:hypothetical protein